MESSNDLSVQLDKSGGLRSPAAFFALIILVLTILGIMGVYLSRMSQDEISREDFLKKFASEEEFGEYLSESREGFSVGIGAFSPMMARDMAVMEAAPTSFADESKVSQTNVQVQGIDEPDIVKTDGESIFFSPSSWLWGVPIIEPVPFETQDSMIESVVESPPPVSDDIDTRLADPEILPFTQPTTKVISAIPAEDISVVSEISENGELLLFEDKLVVITDNKIVAYDVSQKQSPSQSWNYNLEENFYYQSARLYDGDLYVVSARYASTDIVCPMPVLRGTSELTVACTDIYYPIQRTSSDTIYSISKIDASTGELENSMTIVGSSSESVFYMSPEALFVTYSIYPDPLDFLADFLSENSDLFSDEVNSRIDNLRSLSISNESKMFELNIIMQDVLSELTFEEQESFNEQIRERMTSWMSARGEDLQKTAIVKVNRDSLSPSASVQVPGTLLNQFSLDEFEGNLRVATTLSASTMFGSGDSVNNLYVLDSNLSKLGEIKGLAPGERIFSARFIGPRGYLVTFEEIDPFFVIDLTNPREPKVTGELKIPGFSSYLHPLEENLVLGIGQDVPLVEEGSFIGGVRSAKASLFDVSNPSNPVEKDVYILDDYWSEVQNDHHAFIHDPENKVFFMPAGASGYIFSYDPELEVVREIQDISARRAVFIDNYFYIIGDQEIVVLNSENWDEVSRLALQ